MRYLSALPSLRFLAAAMIVVHHTCDYFGYGSWLEHTLLLDQGVSFFFVLSGFILFYTNGAISSRGEAWRFLVARIARIWPLQAATLVLTVLFVPQPWGPAGPSLQPALANLLLLQSWVPLPGYFFSFNAVSWSLSTELFFYLCFPVLALSWRRTWSWKITLCAAGAACMIWAAGAAKLPFYDGSAHLSIDSLVYINPVARIFEFSLGILAAHFWLRWRGQLAALSIAAATLLEVGAVSLVGLAMTRLFGVYNLGLTHGIIAVPLMRWTISSGTAPFFALLIAALASERGLLSWVLAWSPFVLLGDISFAFYMCHQILFRSLLASGTITAFGGLGWQCVSYWAMTLGLSYGLFQLVEKPCRRALLDLMQAGINRTGLPLRPLALPPSVGLSSPPLARGGQLTPSPTPSSI